MNNVSNNTLNDVPNDVSSNALKNPLNNVLEKVLPWGFCCNCGVCSAVCPKECLEMKLDAGGEYRPTLADGKSCVSCGLCLQVCPYSGEVPENEESLGLKLFPNGKTEHSEALGRWDDAFIAASAVESVRRNAPSGGITTSLLCALLESGKIDAAVVAKPMLESPWFEPMIADTSEKIHASSGSVYHVMTLGPVLKKILHDPPKRYALTALPCAVKAIRLAQKNVPELRKRIPYVFSLTCGGCNCLHVADLLCVMLRDRKSGLKYRSKVHTRLSQDYRITTLQHPDERQVRLLGLFGFLWINHVGHLNTCGMCDDLFAALADATFMDAWLDECFADCRGTNLAVTRNPEITQLLEKEISDGRLTGKRVSAEKIVESQTTTLRERHHTAALRWHYEKSVRPNGTPLPSKRDFIVNAALTSEDLREARARVRFQRQTRKYLAKASRRHSNPESWYSRIYVYRVFWKVLCSLTLNGLLSKTLKSLKFMKRKTS